MSLISKRVNDYIEACQSQDIHLQDASLGKVVVTGRGKLEVRAQRRTLFCNVLGKLDAIGPMDSIVVLLNTLSVTVVRRQAQAGNLVGNKRSQLQCTVNRQIGHFAEELNKIISNGLDGANSADPLACSSDVYTLNTLHQLPSNVRVGRLRFKYELEIVLDAAIDA